MATRLYFPSATTVPITPTPAATWNYTSEFRRGTLLFSRLTADTDIPTLDATNERIGPWTPGEHALVRQWVSAPLPAGIAFATTDTVKMQVLTYEQASSDNVFTEVGIRVLSNDGSTVRATLLAVGQHGPATEVGNIAGGRNKTWISSGTVLAANYTTVDGDRLVIECGGTDSSGTTPEMLVKWGASLDTSSGNADAAENETTTTNVTGWIEFSRTFAAQVAPTAAFSGTPLSGDAPLEVTFTDASTAPASWDWDFGDGTGTSTEQNPVYEYQDPGTYTVTLTVTNSVDTDDEVKTDYVTADAPLAPPVADFSADEVSGEAPLTVQFTDLSTNTPDEWAWDFGDSVGTSTDQNPEYEYEDPGTYTVTLTATNAGGSDDEVKVAYIYVSAPFVAGGNAIKATNMARRRWR